MMYWHSHGQNRGTEQVPELTSPSELSPMVPDWSRQTISSTASTSSTMYYVSDHPGEDGVTSTEVDLVFNLDHDLSSDPRAIPKDDTRSPRVSGMSEAETSTSANCPESGKFVDNVLQLVLPSGGSAEMATKTSETTSEIEKELLIETKSDLKPNSGADNFWCGGLVFMA